MLQMSSSTSDYERHKNNNNTTTTNGGGSGRSSRNKKKGAPFMFFSNILKKKKVLDIDEIREMNTRTRSEPSGELFCVKLAVRSINVVLRKYFNFYFIKLFLFD